MTDDGRPPVLVLRGESGVGKTTLLDHAVAESAATFVLRGRGHPAAARAGYGVLGELLRPLLSSSDGWWDRVPAAQQEALSSALHLGPPAEHDRFVICTAAASLLAAVAEVGPTLMAIDDWNLVDPASRDVLTFVFHHLRNDDFAAVVAVTDPEPTGSVAPGLEPWPSLGVGGLDADAVTTLVDAVAGVTPHPDVAATLVDATGGNPLAINEVVSRLGPAELDGSQPLPSPLPVGTTPERIFGPRIGQLSDPARQALTLLALVGPDEAEFVPAALDRLGSGTAGLAELEDAALVRRERHRLELVHPLLRLAAVETAPAVSRRAAHRALAEAMGESRLYSHAWHLAESIVGTDEEVAATLDRAAAAVLATSGYATAAAAYERAAAVGRSGDDRARRLLNAAEAAVRAGASTEAFRLLDDVIHAAQAPPLRAAAEQIRGRLDLFAGRPHHAGTLLRHAAQHADENARAARALVDASIADFLAGEEAAAMRTAGAAVEQAGGTATEWGYIGETIIISALLHLGEVREALDRFERLPPIPVVPEMEYVLFGSLLFVWLGQPAEAALLLDGVTLELRRSHALGLLPLALYASGYATLLSGRVRAAHILMSEGYALAETTGDALWRYMCAGGMARVELQRAEVESCRRYAAEARKLHESMDLFYPRDAEEALGMLALLQGDPAESLDLLAPPRSLSADAGFVLDWVTGPDLAEARVRSGQKLDDHWVTELEALAEEVAHLPFAAAANRSLGITANDRDRLGRAVELYDEAGLPFGRARSQLLIGESLRREGSLAAARTQLQEACRVFEKLGSELWAARAREELARTGERVPAPTPDVRHQLTPHELRVAVEVAKGLTNREVAAALFLSVKTVEMHLSRVFRKLGVRTRAELAGLFARQLPDATASSP